MAGDLSGETDESVAQRRAIARLKRTVQKQTDEMNRLKNEWTVTKTPNVKRKDTLQKNTKLTERMGSDTDAKEIGRIAIVFRAKTVHFKKYGKQNFVDTTYSRYYNKKAIKITKQEHARVRAALAEKYARRYSEGRPLPELDYVHLGEQGKLNTAYMYIVRNYDFGSFEVVGKHSSDSKYSENARRDIDEFNNRAGMETDGAKDAGRSDNRDMRSDTEIGREEPEAAGLDRGASESERAGSAVDVAGDLGRTGRRGRGGQRGRDGELRKWQNKTGVITSKYKSYEMYWNEYGGDQYKIKIKRVKEL